MLRNERCRAGAACRSENEVAWVGGHHDATFNNLRIGLDHIDRVARTPNSIPQVAESVERNIVLEADIPNRVAGGYHPPNTQQELHCLPGVAPPTCARGVRLPFPFNGISTSGAGLGQGLGSEDSTLGEESTTRQFITGQ